jgi:hypothetical protein
VLRQRMPAVGGTDGQGHRTVENFRQHEQLLFATVRSLARC